MAGEAEVQVSHFLDQHGLGAFQVKLVVWSILIAMIDGYDIGAIAFAAPHLIAEWHCPAASARAGAQRQQYRRLVRLADFRLDRRPLWAQVGADPAPICCSASSLSPPPIRPISPNCPGFAFSRDSASAASSPISSPSMPNSAPRNLRATLAIIAAGLCRWAARWPASPAPCWCRDYGWQILFEIGGVVPIVSRLPPSSDCRNRSNTWRCTKASAPRSWRCSRPYVPISRCRPMRASSSRTKSNRRAPIRSICSATGLAAITPLTWLMFAFNLMGYFFLISWTPTLMAAAHVPPATAALAGAALQVGGTVGALVLCWWLQRQRFLAIAILFVIAVPVVGSIGYAGTELDGTAADSRHLPRRRAGARHPVRHQCGRRA